MLAATFRDLIERLSLSFRVLVSPSRATFYHVNQASTGQWVKSLAIYALGVGLVTLFVFLLIGEEPEIVFILSTAYSFGVIAVAWAFACQGLTYYLLRHRPNLFEPLLYLASTALLLLLIGTALLSALPDPAALLSIIPLIYAQVIVVLAIRALGQTSATRAAAIAIGSALFAFVVTYSFTSIVSGMPGFFERGTLF